MATRKKKRKKVVRKRNKSRCRCPRGSTKLSTRGVALGFACQSNTRRKTRGRLKNVGKYFYPFVKAVCR